MKIEKPTLKQIASAAAITGATAMAIEKKLPASVDYKAINLIFTGCAVGSCLFNPDCTKTRFAISAISGLLISDALLLPSSDPKINLLKTAGVVGSIYYALSPSAKQIDRDAKSGEVPKVYQPVVSRNSAAPQHLPRVDLTNHESQYGRSSAQAPAPSIRESVETRQPATERSSIRSSAQAPARSTHEIVGRR